MDISLLLRMAADAEPGRVALTCEGRHWTYGALWSAATGAAAAIARSGCGHVALLDTGGALIVDAGTFAVSMACLLAMSGRAPVHEGEHEPLRDQLREATRFVRGETWLWATLIMAALALFILNRWWQRRAAHAPVARWHRRSRHDQ